MSFEGEQQRIEHTGSRKKFSAAYISMVWPEEKLMTYDFYDKMDSMNTIRPSGESQDTYYEKWLVEKTDTHMG